ncbi:SDR family oxidoreductase [Devosia sp. 1566]|uniref:SDR family NAD(P)-dependent oxidoreductase n=1 Tax=Devosia sp. 1566 TaxID=2499144 RepID=UPI000FDA8F93|nr:SDR family oxidoreductase [Devosia sp. 1566]
MDRQFDRAVLITGAGSGIGAATALAVAGSGTALLLHTRQNQSGLDEIARQCRERGSVVETMLGDLAEPAVPQTLVRATRQHFGRIDQIVSNAGQAHKSTFGALTPEDVERAFAAMPLAFVRLATAALSDLESSDWARVVVVSSFVAHVFGTNNLLFPASAAAKAALEALAKSLASQLAPQGVTVNCVVPGFTRKDQSGHAATSREAMESATGVTPIGRLAEPGDIANGIVYLLSRGARQVTGQTLHIDGGLMLP